MLLLLVMLVAEPMHQSPDHFGAVVVVAVVTAVVGDDDTIVEY